MAAVPAAAGTTSPEQAHRGAGCLRCQQGAVDSWSFQIIVLGVALVHAYFQLFADIIKESKEGDWDSVREQVALIYWTGGPVALLSIYELFVRVIYQAGPICCWSSWKTFATPTFHKAELFMHMWLVNRVVVLIYVGVVALLEPAGGYNEYIYAKTSNSFTASVFLALRVLRAWGLYSNVSVQTSRRKAWERKNLEKLWSEEHRQRKQRYEAQKHVRFTKMLDRWPAQFAIYAAILGHCSIWGASITWDSFEFLYDISAGTGYGLLIGLCSEFFMRCYTQGGEHFFIPYLHKAEVFLLVPAIHIILYTCFFHSAIRDGESMITPSSTLLFVVLTLHRVTRCLGVHYEVSAHEWETDSIMNAVFQRKIEDILDVPVQNILVQVGPTIQFRIQRASVKAEALGNLHAPLRLKGGLVEDVHITIPPAAKRSRRMQPTLVKVKNLLLAFEPGNGLAEEPPGRYWHYETVLKAKSELIELLCKRLSPATGTAVEKSSAALEQSASPALNPAATSGGLSQRAASFARPNMLSAAQTVRRQMTRIAKSVQASVRGQLQAAVECLEVDVRNVVIQYLDEKCELGLGHVSMGMKLASLQVQRIKGRSFSCSLSQLGCYVESLSEGAGSDGGAHRHSSLTSSIRNPVPPERKASGLRSAEISRSSGQQDEQVSQPGSVTRSLSPSAATLTESAAVFFRGASATSTTLGDSSVISAGLYREAVNAMRRANVAMRMRTWCLEALEQQRQLTARARHRRYERWPEKNYIFFVPRVSVTGQARDLKGSRTVSQRGVDYSAASRIGLSLMRVGFAQELLELATSSMAVSQGRRSTRSCGSTGSDDAAKAWEWDVNINSRVRVSLDRDQAARLQSLRRRVEEWMDMDAAFKWRPEQLSSLSAAATVVNDASDTHAIAKRRAVVARMWWIYAIKRVLVTIRKRPHMPWLDMRWYAAHRLRYQALLNEVAKRPGTVQALLAPAFAAERRWLQELEMRLPLQDIVACRRKALSVAMMEQNKVGGDRSENGKAGNNWTGAEMEDVDVEWASEDVQEGLNLGGAEQLTVLEELQGQLEDDIARNISSLHETFNMSTSNPSPTHGGRGGVDSHPPLIMELIRRSIGSWSIHVQEVSISLMPSGGVSMPRPVALQVLILGVHVDMSATLPPQGEGEASSPRPDEEEPVLQEREEALHLESLPFSGNHSKPMNELLTDAGATVTVAEGASLKGQQIRLALVVQYLGASCPDMSGEIHGGSRMVFNPTGRILDLAAEDLGLCPESHPGRRQCCLASTVAMTTGSRIDVKVHVADYRAIYYQVLCDKLRATVEGRPLQPQPQQGQQLQQRQQPVYPRRWWQQHQQARPERAEDTTAAGAALQSRMDALQAFARSRVRLRKWQRRLEILSGIQLRAPWMLVDLNLGGMQGFRVQPYNAESLLVEQVRCLPFNGLVSRGEVDKTEARTTKVKPFGHHQISLHANQFKEDAVLSWGAAPWTGGHFAADVESRVSKGKAMATALTVSQAKEADSSLRQEQRGSGGAGAAPFPSTSLSSLLCCSSKSGAHGTILPGGPSMLDAPGELTQSRAFSQKDDDDALQGLPSAWISSSIPSNSAHEQVGRLHPQQQQQQQQPQPVPQADMGDPLPRALESWMPLRPATWTAEVAFEVCKIYALKPSGPTKAGHLDQCSAAWRRQCAEVLRSTCQHA